MNSQNQPLVPILSIVMIE